MSEIDYNDGKWHHWNGGRCPVHPKTIVEYLWLGSTGSLNKLRVRPASGVAWVGEYLGKMSDPITAFRVVNKYREPRIWWLHPKWGYVTDIDPHDSSYVQVREIMSNDES